MKTSSVGYISGARRVLLAIVAIFLISQLAACASLHDAAGAGNINAVRSMLDKGADVNAKDYNGFTPLHLTASMGHTETARLLIERGADINAKDKHGYAPLHWAVENGDIETTKYLIEHGADINANKYNTDGSSYMETPLHLAAQLDNTEIVKLLIKHGSNIDIKSLLGTPLAIARKHKKYETVEIIREAMIKQGKIPWKDRKRQKVDVFRTSRDSAVVQGRMNEFGGERRSIYVSLMALDAVEVEELKRKYKDWHDKMYKEYLPSLENPEQVAMFKVRMEKWKDITLHSLDLHVTRETTKSKDKGLPFTISRANIQQQAITSSVDTPPSTRMPVNPNAYAVVIGIEKYRERLPDAPYAKSDAETMAKYLTKSMGFEKRNVALLINDRATRSDLSKYLGTWLRNRVKPGSRVFIYFSGHGAPDVKTSSAYIVPYDGDPTYISDTGYPLKKLYEDLGKLKAGEIIVALDSCFSGAGGRSVIARGARPIALTLKNPAIAAGNMVILSASSGAQASSTYEDKGHGLFTYYLLKGLQGAADANQSGNISVKELHEYIGPRVETIALEEYNNEQTPQMMDPSGLSSEMVLIKK